MKKIPQPSQESFLMIRQLSNSHPVSNLPLPGMEGGRALSQLFLFFHSKPFKQPSSYWETLPHLRRVLSRKTRPHISPCSSRDVCSCLCLSDPHLPSSPSLALSSCTCHFDHSKNVASTTFAPWDATWQMTQQKFPEILPLLYPGTAVAFWCSHSHQGSHRPHDSELLWSMCPS